MKVTGNIAINTLDGRSFSYVRDVVVSGSNGSFYLFDADLGETFTQANGVQVYGLTNGASYSKPNIDQYLQQQQGIATSWQSLRSITTTTQVWNNGIYANGNYVVVGTDATNSVSVSTNLSTWTPKTLAGGSWFDVMYVKEWALYIACGNNTTSGIATSPDASTWTTKTTPSFPWNALAYSPLLGIAAVAGANTTSSILTSIDGTTFNTQTTPTGVYSDIIWSNYWKKFITVGTNVVASSVNGTTWTAGTIPASAWSGIAEGNNGLLVAVSSTSSAASAAWSIDGGATWTAGVSINAAWNKVMFFNGLFVAVGNNTTSSVMTSIDGKTWTARTTANFSLRGIFSDGTKLLTVGGSGATNLQTSADTGGYIYGDFIAIMDAWKNGTGELLLFPESYGPSDTISRINDNASGYSLVKNYFGIKRTNIASVYLIIQPKDFQTATGALGNRY